VSIDITQINNIGKSIASAVIACTYIPPTPQPIPPDISMTLLVLVLPPNEAAVIAWIESRGGTCTNQYMIADVHLKLAQIQSVLAQPGVIRFRRPGRLA
jgi:hypothetical protein